MHYLGRISGDDLFLEITASLGRKPHYQKMTSSKEFFLEITMNLGRKLVLNKPSFMTRFWYANCMTSLKGHRTRLKLLKIYFNETKNRTD